MTEIPSQSTLSMCAGMLSGVEGDVAEVGVHRGNTFLRLISLFHGRMCHGFDSFRGMAEPGPRDSGPNEDAAYPAGKFDVGGAATVKRRLFSEGLDGHHWRIYEGWVPDVFAQAPAALRLAFGYLDVDHYEPTRHGLTWLWDRLVPRGLVLCDDWFPGRTWCATLAIDEWMAEHDGEFDVVATPERQIVLQRKV